MEIIKCQESPSDLADNRNSHTWLLGDSGYPLEPWLMTPLPATNNQAEMSYNAHLTKAQSIIEQCNGLLKNRWRCLIKHRVLHYHPETASNIIIACVVLHNMCVKNNIALDETEILHLEEDSQDIFPENEGNHSVLSEARHVQQRLIRLCFS